MTTIPRLLTENARKSYIISAFFLVYAWLTICRHTGVVVYGQEFFYGGMGIESCPPVSIIHLKAGRGIVGMTFKTGCAMCLSIVQSSLLDYLAEVSPPSHVRPFLVYVITYLPGTTYSICSSPPLLPYLSHYLHLTFPHCPHPTPLLYHLPFHYHHHPLMPTHITYLY